MQLKFSVPDAFERRLARFISFDLTGRPIGRDGRIRLNFFLDMLKAVHSDENLHFFSEVFSDFLQAKCALDSISGVVGPKFGNALLVRDVARRLRKRSAFVRDGVLFGQWVEGFILPGDKVLLIDDVACDGEVLRECAENLRSAGVFVDKVIVLVDRPEGDTDSQFGSSEIQFLYVVRYTDAELQRILAQYAAC